MSVEISERNKGLKNWRLFAIIWPLLCLTFAVTIIFQSNRSVDERISDIMFTIFPLIFFAIGMKIRRRMLKERMYATMITTATVISQGRRMRMGNHRAFFPEFEFQAGETIYKVTSPSGSGVCLVTEGRKVELYYNPQNPRDFYVPIMHKHDRRCAMLFCGIGVVFPLIGLFAPLIRGLFPFE